jgi:indole-3-glycerol phosphate synthase
LKSLSDALARICATTREVVATRKAAQPTETLRAKIADHPHTPRPFAAALPGLIAELKRASPSAGPIRHPFDTAALAREYEQAGAACLSILTETSEFQGTLTDLQAARAATNLPALRKDFILDPWQLYESRLAGADCILLIMAALDPAEATDLTNLARSLNLEVLVESHNEPELERALTCDTPLIGINNRNLKTLQTDLAMTERLAPLVPRGRIVISESGIRTNADIARLKTHGVHSFLVGESLLRQPDLTAATRALLAP